jgi:hypothetical protein
MKSSLFRAGALVGVIGLAAAGLVMQTGGVSASPASVGLFPAAGSSATGGGSIFFDPMMSPMTITVNITGAKPSTIFNVAACSSFGACTSSGLASQFTTSAVGSANATVTTPAVAPVSFITVTEAGNPADSFVANTAGFGVVTYQTTYGYPGYYPYGVPYYGYYPTVGRIGTPYFGFYVAPGGATYLAPANYSACPLTGTQGNQNSPRPNYCVIP